jgi:hypothetical protein
MADTKPFWLVFSGHYVFHWKVDSVGVYVPNMTKPQPHRYVVWDGTQFVPIAAGPRQLTGLGALETSTFFPDPAKHFRRTSGVQMDPENGKAHATIAPFPKPSSIRVIAGRTANAKLFRNTTAEGSVMSPPADGRYSLADTTVWEYLDISSPPAFSNGGNPISAVDLGEVYAMIFKTEHPPAGPGAQQIKKGANDILSYLGVGTDYRFAEKIIGQVPFKNYAGFEAIKPFLETPGAEGGIPMGSCDQDNGGPP